MSLSGIIEICPTNYTLQDNRCVRSCADNMQKKPLSMLIGPNNRNGNLCVNMRTKEAYPDSMSLEEATLFKQLFNMVKLLPPAIQNAPLKIIASSLISGIVMLAIPDGKNNILFNPLKMTGSANEAAAKAAAENVKKMLEMQAAQKSFAGIVTDATDTSEAAIQRAMAVREIEKAAAAEAPAAVAGAPPTAVAGAGAAAAKEMNGGSLNGIIE